MHNSPEKGKQTHPRPHAKQLDNMPETSDRGKSKEIVGMVTVCEEVDLYAGWIPLYQPCPPVEKNKVSVTNMEWKTFPCNHSVPQPKVVSEVMNNALGNPLGMKDTPNAALDNDVCHVLAFEQVRPTTTLTIGSGSFKSTNSMVFVALSYE